MSSVESSVEPSGRLSGRSPGAPTGADLPHPRTAPDSFAPRATGRTVHPSTGWPHRTVGAHRSTGARHRARIYSLDGLRGVAAVVVFVHHVLLTQPVLAEAHRGDAQGPTAWLLTHTPLHLIWAGTEAVFVFFVLSGLVLALPTAAGGRIDLAAHYSRRLLRLYLPVWAAVVLALGIAAAVPHVWRVGDSSWLRSYAGPTTAAGVRGDLLLIHAPGTSNHVLWSLQWEVVYCLALPLVLVPLRAARGLWWLTGPAVLVALAAGAALDIPALWYLSIFALGTLMAVQRPRLARRAAGLDGLRRAGRWWAVTAGIGVVLLLSWWFLPVSGFGPAEVGAVRALQAVGGCVIVFTAWFCPAARTVLNSAPVQWFGDRSFSLYLVHLPVVIAVTAYLGGQPYPVGVLVLSSVIALPLAAAFHRFVEQPAHRLARGVGRAISRARAPERPAWPAPGPVPWPPGSDLATDTHTVVGAAGR